VADPLVHLDITVLDEFSDPLDHVARRTLAALAPRALVLELAGQIQAESLDRGAQMDIGKAEHLARTFLSIPGIGRAIFDAYYSGTGAIQRHGDKFRAVDPRRIVLKEDRDDRADIPRSGRGLLDRLFGRDVPADG